MKALVFGTDPEPVDQWRSAFETLIRQGETGAIKVAFDFR